MSGKEFFPDEDTDVEIRQMEQEEPPVPHPGLIYQPIRPVLGESDYQALKGCFLLPEHGPRDIQPNTVYFDRERKQIKFLVLKGVLSDSYQRAEDALRRADWGNATRKSAGSQPKPRKITWGFFPQTPGHVAGNEYESIRNQATLEQPWLAQGLKPLVKKMDACLQEYLPTDYPKALQHALHADWRDDSPEDDWTRVPTSPLPEITGDSVSLVKGVRGPWGDFTYTLWGTVFSTLELNKHILFKAHEDADNIKGDLICIAALGDWVGGRLIFPRYGYGADLAPTDLLICDNANELHGNIGPLVGPRQCPRFSVVAFMHSSILDYANREGLWRPKVWDCHAGEKYPSGAVYVGCRVPDRKGGVIREGHIFGNGTNPLVSHHGGFHTEQEFRAYAVEKLSTDPAFSAEAENLRRKDLLCWSKQDGPARDEFCHARVWLDLINNPRAIQRQEFPWGYYEPYFLSKKDADALFAVAKAQPRFRPIVPRSGHPLRRCPSTTWSVRDRHADDSELMVPLAEAPPEIVSLQRKLSDLAGKQVNYFSLQAYEDEKDHIDFHQHREDKCRDARVFIISLGERRSFAVDKLCPECLLCDACNRERCQPNGLPCSNPQTCKAAKKHRTTCAVRKSPKTVLLPEHGSLIALSSEANDWYEHAVLNDKEPKGVRISINTKCIPPEDAAEGYVPRELRHRKDFSRDT